MKQTDGNLPSNWRCSETVTTQIRDLVFNARCRDAAPKAEPCRAQVDTRLLLEATDGIRLGPGRAVRGFHKDPAVFLDPFTGPNARL